MSALDRSHDPLRTSWVASADGHIDFPIQNLPFGSMQDSGGMRRVVVAIGDLALPLDAALHAGWGAGLPDGARAVAQSLNAFAARPPAEWTAVRVALSDALADDEWRDRLAPLLVPIDALSLALPFSIHDYTDFYASIYHATNVGSMFRPDNPLLPNYKWVPIGYHGRASSIVISGTDIRRPHGQVSPPGATSPTFAASRSLDYELELGIYIGGSNAIGEAVTARDAPSRIFGLSLLNDWSARDIQSWEYQPLGPFLAKNFATSVSPWVITADALRPFRVPMPLRSEGDPAPLPYLQIPDDTTYRIQLDVSLRTSAARASEHDGAPISSVDFSQAMYWSPGQLVAHHGSNGCNLTPGDLLGTGTISGPAAEARGCLLERTWRGAEPLAVGQETRTFLQDGDEVVMRGRCAAPDATPIGFGVCRGVVLPA